MGHHKTDICIIGAGMAGLACATRLAEAGHSIAVLDKGRGPGGRMSTRRAEILGETVSFDHGAQYFTARDAGFLAAVKEWVALGVAAPWPAAGDDAYVGVPGMNGPIRGLAQSQNVSWGTRAESIKRSDDGWIVSADNGSFAAKTVLVAIPPEQAATMVELAAPELADVARKVKSNPCWAVMAGFEQRLDIEEDTVRAKGAPISWAARNSAKPARAGDECWVIHASADRSHELIDLSADEAAQILLADFFGQTRTEPAEPVHLAAHRWLYSMAEAVAGEPSRFDSANSIGIAGDYLHSPRVEGAWLSGVDLAEKVLAPA